MKRLAAIFLLMISITALPVSAAPDEPIFAGIWSKKEPGGVGGFFYDQSWDQLVSNWRSLARGQYLADVEPYKVGDRWRYAAVWRIGRGNGALLLAPWDQFNRVWNNLKKTQDLIDLEILETDDGLKYLGVWRAKQKPGGTGALFVGLSWDQLVAKRAELRTRQYLADVEVYGNDRHRLFAGVWRVGAGNGALYWKAGWADFSALRRSLNESQEMLDFEMFQSASGAWNFLGVWRFSNRAGPLHASTSNATFQPLSAAQFVDRWKKNQRRTTLIGIDVAVPITPPLKRLRGDTSCKYGDKDCNRCATNVPNQFLKTNWHKRSWTFTGKTRYAPDNMKPEDAFKPWDRGLTGKHIQGFVRTNSSRFPYAGSHSHKHVGSIFFLGQSGNDIVLRSLYRSHKDHPSGVAILGDGLFVAEGDRLRWFDVEAAGDRQDYGYNIKKKKQGDTGLKGLQGGGGGLGLAKLEGGTTLLIVSAPGDGFRWGANSDKNLRPVYTRFYRLVPDAFATKPDMELIGEWRHEGITKHPDKPMAYSENLSVVTECGSGHIYTIHTTGDYKLLGKGYWRLSRVKMENGRPRLVHVAIKDQKQNFDRCHHRSSATVHVNSAGKLEYLCTERAVIKHNPTGRFSFLEGQPSGPEISHDKYTAVWRPGSGAQWWRTNMTLSQVKAQDEAYVRQGLRLVDVEISNGRYTAVWRPGSGAQWWNTNMTLSQVKAKDEAYFRQGLRLVDVEVH